MDGVSYRRWRQGPVCGNRSSRCSRRSASRDSRRVHRVEPHRATVEHQAGDVRERTRTRAAAFGQVHGLLQASAEPFLLSNVSTGTGAQPRSDISWNSSGRGSKTGAHDAARFGLRRPSARTTDARNARWKSVCFSSTGCPCGVFRQASAHASFRAPSCRRCSQSAFGHQPLERGDRMVVVARTVVGLTAVAGQQRAPRP